MFLLFVTACAVWDMPNRALIPVVTTADVARTATIPEARTAGMIALALATRRGTQLARGLGWQLSAALVAVVGPGLFGLAFSSLAFVSRALRPARWCLIRRPDMPDQGCVALATAAFDPVVTSAGPAMRDGVWEVCTCYRRPAWFSRFRCAPEPTCLACSPSGASDKQSQTH